jgi:galactokinase
MITVKEDFSKLFGNQAEIVAAAPGRVNLVGEHIDFLDGFVLPFAIEAVTIVALSRTPQPVIRISSEQQENKITEIALTDLAPLSGEPWTRYPIGVIWAIRDALNYSGGFDILVSGQVPLGAGLSSSAALECAVATALNSLFKLNIPETELARVAQKAENIYVGMPCGIMDQSVSIMGKKGYALLLDCRDLSTEHIPFDISPLGLELLVIDTQVHHDLTDGGYAERRSSCEKAVAQLGIASLRDITVADFVARKSELDETTFARAFHGVTEMKRVLDGVEALKSGDFEEFGKIITQSHISLRDNYKVSCPELNVAVETALGMGALGSRMIGGGYGGSSIALIRKDQTQDIKNAIAESFKREGFVSPRFFISLPSAGARVLI